MYDGVIGGLREIRKNAMTLFYHDLTRPVAVECVHSIRLGARYRVMRSAQVGNG